MKIIVYTAIVGKIDRLWSVCPVASRNAEHVCFSDQPLREVGLWNGKRILLDTGELIAPKTWEIRQIVPEWGPRRTARHYKCLPHRYLPNADVWIWVDGNVRLTIPPQTAIRDWLKRDLMTFNHPERACLYVEAEFCAKYHKDKAEILEAQTKRYREEGMPLGWGLAETRCVIRRNTPEICTLNEAWWAEIEAGSQRDQVSFPYVCWRAGIQWDAIPGHCGKDRSHTAFCYVRHHI